MSPRTSVCIHWLVLGCSSYFHKHSYFSKYRKYMFVHSILHDVNSVLQLQMDGDKKKRRNKTKERNARSRTDEDFSLNEEIEKLGRIQSRERRPVEIQSRKGDPPSIHIQSRKVRHTKHPASSRRRCSIHINRPNHTHGSRHTPPDPVKNRYAAAETKRGKSSHPCTGGDNEGDDTQPAERSRNWHSGQQQNEPPDPHQPPKAGIWKKSNKTNREIPSSRPKHRPKRRAGGTEES